MSTTAQCALCGLPWLIVLRVAQSWRDRWRPAVFALAISGLRLRLGLRLYVSQSKSCRRAAPPQGAAPSPSFFPDWSRLRISELAKCIFRVLACSCRALQPVFSQDWRDPAGFRYPYRPAFVNPETSHDRQSTAADAAVGTGVQFLPHASTRKEGCRFSLGT